MSEKDFSDALLRGDDPIDLQALTQAALRRDRRRIWFLGIACVIAWMAVVMLPWATILPMVAKVAKQQMVDNRAGAGQTAKDREHSTLELAKVIEFGTVAAFFSSMLSMFVAAVCTVLLIVLSRRATLRQVNVRLAEISAQLRTLAAKPN